LATLLLVEYGQVVDSSRNAGATLETCKPGLRDGSVRLDAVRVAARMATAAVGVDMFFCWKANSEEW
jgi:hypothetical protein